MFGKLTNTFDPRVVAALHARLLTKDDTANTNIKRYRKYMAGDQPDPLTDEQRDFLSEDIDYTFNVCPTVVRVPADRLKVRQFQVSVPDELAPEADPETGEVPETLSDQLTKVVNKVWGQNQMDERSADLHTLAGRDGNCYLIVDFDDKRKRVRLTVNLHHDGDVGMKAIYPDDDFTTPKYFVKEWDETLGTTTETPRKIKRRTLYYPNRVERWVMDPKRGSGWQPYDANNVSAVTNEDGVTYRTTVVWLTVDGGPESPDNPALGFPAQHFRVNANGSAQGESDLAQIVPGVQDALNIKHAMISAAEQLQAVPIAILFTDAKLPRALDYFPGGIIKIPGPGTVDHLEPADLAALNDSFDAALERIEILTTVPISRRNATGQIAAEGTLMQQESGLLAKVKRRQVSFGNRYEEIIRTILRWMVIFDKTFTLLGSGAEAFARIDTLEVSCIWEPAEVRNETEEIERVATKVEKLSVPIEQAWNEVGYTQDQISDMQKMKQAASETQDTENAQLLGELAAMMNEGRGNETQQPNGTAPNGSRAPAQQIAA